MASGYTSVALKECRGCKQILLATSQFWHRHPKTRDGWKLKCKVCCGYRYKTILESNEKQCSKCRKVLPRDIRHFHNHKKQRDGFACACKVCRGSHYGTPQENRDRVADSIRKYPKTQKHYHTATEQIYRMKCRSDDMDVVFRYTLKSWHIAKAYFNHSCAICGQSRFDKNGDTVLSPDHWIPISKGGDSVAENIIPLCHGLGGCNNSKSNRNPVEWLHWRYNNKVVNEILDRINSYFDHVKERNAA